MFPFHEINNLPFILDLAQGEESEGCSAGLTDGMVVQSEGHIGYLIKYQIKYLLNNYKVIKINKINKICKIQIIN